MYFVGFGQSMEVCDGESYSGRKRNVPGLVWEKQVRIWRNKLDARQLDMWRDGLSKAGMCVARQVCQGT